MQLQLWLALNIVSFLPLPLVYSNLYIVDSYPSLASLGSNVYLYDNMRVNKATEEYSVFCDCCQTTHIPYFHTHNVYVTTHTNDWDIRLLI